MPSEVQVAWSEALKQMRRTNPIYKPAVLGAYLELSRAGHAQVELGALSVRFGELLGVAGAPRKPSIKTPLGGLENDGILRVEGGMVRLSDAHTDAGAGENRERSAAALRELLERDEKPLSQALARALSS